MLVTFPTAFSQATFPKRVFLSSNFPNVQFPKWQLTKSFLATALGIP